MKQISLVVEALHGNIEIMKQLLINQLESVKGYSVTGCSVDSYSVNARVELEKAKVKICTFGGA